MSLINPRSAERLDGDQAWILGAPDVGSLFEGQEPNGLVERAGSLIFLRYPRGAKRLDLKKADAVGSQIALDTLEQFTPDAVTMQIAPNCEKLDFGRD